MGGVAEVGRNVSKGEQGSKGASGLILQGSIPTVATPRPNGSGTARDREPSVPQQRYQQQINSGVSIVEYISGYHDNFEDEKPNVITFYSGM